MSINVYQLPIEQLEGLKEQLDNDMRSLGAAYDGLYSGRSRYQNNRDVVDQYRIVCENAARTEAAQEVLVCMTSSLFVRGTVVPSDKVLVDVGTGYFLEQSIEHAKRYFVSRAAQIKESMDQVEQTISMKQRQQNQVIDALQQKTLAMQRYREEHGEA
ncbi:hypothetical protein LSCM1_02911 [Leishmania martiniquensis]|uniref:Prefoldin 5-like protein n=1 Tax=Leishmania martiniquensis TaxID=1580590 RepID=A0A836GBT1_9TRYP|nr:hypothetical protein LSCM1_02911 [Leishmania martiniquensis]